MNIFKITKLVKKGKLNHYLTLDQIKKENNKINLKKILSIPVGLLAIVILSKIPMNETIAIIASCTVVTGSILTTVHYTEIQRKLREIIETSKKANEEVTNEDEEQNMATKVNNQPEKVNNQPILSTKESLEELKSELTMVNEKVNLNENSGRQNLKVKNFNNYIDK